MDAASIAAAFEVTLKEGEHACYACGRATTGDTIKRLDSLGRVAVVGGEAIVYSDPASTGTFEFGECETCQQRQEAARALLSEHPAVAAYIGARSIGEHRVAQALDALAVIGAEPPKGLTDTSLWALIDKLTTLGGPARWSSQFAPVRLLGASDKRCAAEPWSHVPLDLRQNIRHAYSDWLASQLPPLEISCPSEGCLLCGISSVMARRNETPWHEFSTSSAALGARGKSKITGHLCPTCWGAYEAEGTVGPALITRALLDGIDPDQSLRKHLRADMEIVDVHPWALSGRPPSSQPWAWLDVDAFRNSLQPTAGPRAARITLKHEPGPGEW